MVIGVLHIILQTRCTTIISGNITKKCIHLFKNELKYQLLFRYVNSSGSGRVWKLKWNTYYLPFKTYMVLQNCKGMCFLYIKNVMVYWLIIIQFNLCLQNWFMKIWLLTISSTRFRSPWYDIMSSNRLHQAGFSEYTYMIYSLNFHYNYQNIIVAKALDNFS